jgi:hypothetical protein
MKPSTRKDALAAGAAFFNTGRPCRNGHTADRYTSTGGCLECLRGHRQEYAALIAAARKPVERTATLFAYRLHPDDHAAALAYCQALDLQRGRQPQAAEVIGQRTAPVRFATPEEVAVHRARIMQELGARVPEGRTGGEHMTEEMRRQLGAWGKP